MAQVCERVPLLIPLTLSQMQWMVGFCQQLVDCSSSRIFFPNKIINFKFSVNLSPSRTIIFLLLSSELYFCWAPLLTFHSFTASQENSNFFFFTIPKYLAFFGLYLSSRFDKNLSFRGFCCCLPAVWCPEAKRNYDDFPSHIYTGILLTLCFERVKQKGCLCLAFNKWSLTLKANIKFWCNLEDLKFPGIILE